MKEAYTEELADEIAQETGKHLVPREEFNKQKKAASDLQKLLEERDATIQQLQESSGDVGTLQKQLDDSNKAHDAEINALKLRFAVRIALKLAYGSPMALRRTKSGSFRSLVPNKECVTVLKEFFPRLLRFCRQRMINRRGLPWRRLFCHTGADPLF